MATFLCFHLETKKRHHVRNILSVAVSTIFKYSDLCHVKKSTAQNPTVSILATSQGTSLTCPTSPIQLPGPALRPLPASIPGWLWRKWFSCVQNRWRAPDSHLEIYSDLQKGWLEIVKYVSLLVTCLNLFLVAWKLQKKLLCSRYQLQPNHC